MVNLTIAFHRTHKHLEADSILIEVLLSEMQGFQPSRRATLRPLHQHRHAVALDEIVSAFPLG